MGQATRVRGVRGIDAHLLQRMLDDGEEIALLDVRETAAFASSHLWLATHVPLSRLELRIRRFVPRLQTRIVLCDDGNGIVERASAVLATMGYDNLYVLQGGVRAWLAAGYSLIDGNYVVAHCFGYFIEEHYHTPVITGDELMAKLDANEDVVILDARDESDFCVASLPNAVSVPAAEVARRIVDLAPDPNTQVVVHCAGVTRAALGAQGLRNCAVANPVFALREGTRGWMLAGGELARNNSVARAHISSAAKAFATNAAQQLARRFDLTYVTHNDLTQWHLENPDRTCYLIDVRSRQEYLDGHYPGTLLIPGGELAGMTIDHIATQHARLALFADEDCARAEITASWMQQLGWSEVVIVSDWKSAKACVTGPEPDYYPEFEELNVTTVSPGELLARLARENLAVIDVSHSEDYQRSHISGSIWASRSQLSAKLDMPDRATGIVITSSRGRLARLAAADLTSCTDVAISVLEGGNEAWRSAGLETESGLGQCLGHIDDVDLNFLETPQIDRNLRCEQYRRIIAWRYGLYPKFKHDQPVQFVVCL